LKIGILKSTRIGIYRPGQVPVMLGPVVIIESVMTTRTLAHLLDPPSSVQNGTVRFRFPSYSGNQGVDRLEGDQRPGLELSFLINVSGNFFKIRHVQLPVIQEWGAYIAPGMT
jgi:hypothetical protein